MKKIVMHVVLISARKKVKFKVRIESKGQMQQYRNRERNDHQGNL